MISLPQQRADSKADALRQKFLLILFFLKKRMYALYTPNTAQAAALARSSTPPTR